MQSSTHRGSSNCLWRHVWSMLNIVPSDYSSYAPSSSLLFHCKSYSVPVYVQLFIAIFFFGKAIMTILRKLRFGQWNYWNFECGITNMALLTFPKLCRHFAAIFRVWYLLSKVNFSHPSCVVVCNRCVAQ